jgi:hypothetical protein
MNFSQIDNTPKFPVARKLLYGEYIYVGAGVHEPPMVALGFWPQSVPSTRAMNYSRRPNVL